MHKEMITLVQPTTDLKESYIEGVQEFQKEGLLWFMDIKLDELQNNFEKYVEAQKNKKTLWTKDTPVDETELWAVSNKTYVGGISIRHKLNRDLQTMGGHIGYDTRPSYRKRGIASEMLRLALPIAKQLGIENALITCNDSNVASIKIIEKNGGVLKETKPQYEGGPLKRYYWIETTR